jgi:hypothetical protein
LEGGGCQKWRDHFATEDQPGHADRSAGPRRSPTRPAGDAEDEIEALRRQRQTGPTIARRRGQPVIAISTASVTASPAITQP